MAVWKRRRPTAAALIALLGCQPTSNPLNTSTQADTVAPTVWSGPGPNPCQSQNPISLVDPTPFLGANDNPRSTHHQTYSFTLPAAANACIVIDATGASATRDLLSVSVDGTYLGGICGSDAQPDDSPCPAPSGPFVLAVPFRDVGGSHQAVVTVRLDELIAPIVRLYAQGPSIAGFTPVTARPGETVTLTGEGFDATTQVYVGSTQYPVSSVAATGDSVTVTVPAQSVTGSFRIITPIATISSIATFFPFLWTCNPPYTIPSYSPAADDGAALDSLAEAAGYAISQSSNWIGAAAGNLCGDAQKELVLAKNSGSYFSVLRGPTPTVVNAWDDFGAVTSSSTDPWQAVAVGNLDAWPLNTSSKDVLVAVRTTASSGIPDLVVARSNQSSCEISALDSQTTLSTTPGAHWVGIAIGDFDGDHSKEIALVRNDDTHFFIVKRTQVTAPDGTVTTRLTKTWSGDLDSGAPPWTGLAAGDIDGDGIDELVATRSASDGQSATIIAYSWNGQTFVQKAFSTFGSDGNSAWAGVTVGDFNADGKASIVVAKNASSNFAVLSYLDGSSILHVTRVEDLQSVEQQDCTPDAQGVVPGTCWRALVATDWLSGADHGAAELLAVRAAHGKYRNDVFVYGDHFERAARDSALENSRAASYFNTQGQYGEWNDKLVTSQLLPVLAGAGANTFHVNLENPSDYAGLVTLLHYTQGYCVNGQQIRVIATLWPHFAKDDDKPGPCSQPLDTTALRRDFGDDAAWSESDFFCEPGTPCLCDAGNPACGASRSVCDAYVTPQGGWAGVLSKLANDYPQLIGIGFDDYSDGIDSYPNDIFTPDGLAAFESRLRAGASWLNFVPTFYSVWSDDRYIGDSFPDIGAAMDTLLFFFRNNEGGACNNAGCYVPNPDKCGACVAGACAEPTIENAPKEICDMKSLLPEKRKLQLGVYFGGLSNCGQPSIRYDFDLARLALANPWLGIGGVTAYTADDLAADAATSCTADNYLDTRFCAAQWLFSDRPSSLVEDIDLTAASCTPQAAVGDPYGFQYEVCNQAGEQDIIYRDSIGHVFDLFRTSTSIGNENLTAEAVDSQTNQSGAALAASDPSAYVFPNLCTRNVVYRSDDGKLHTLSWQLGDVLENNITDSVRDNKPSVPDAIGNPGGYCVPQLDTQNVVFDGISPDGSSVHLHDLYWYTGSVQDDDLTAESGAPDIAGDPVGYVYDKYQSQVVVFRGSDGDLHDVYFWTGAVGHDDLTTESGTPQPDPTKSLAAYVAKLYDVQNIFYVDKDRGDLHELYFNTGPIGHTNLTDGFALSDLPSSGPAAYFVEGDGTNHVFYASQGQHVIELSWTQGAVTERDLTSMINGAPPAVGKPSAYYVSDDQSHHVIYRDGNGHVHELRWPTVP